MIHSYFNEWHLGDCLWHCLFLRRMALENPTHTFIFYCNKSYHNQLAEVVSDLVNILIRDLECRAFDTGDHLAKQPNGTFNSWIDANYKNMGKRWSNHPLHYDIIGYLMDWFSIMAYESGLKWTAQQREDLLFNYPRLSGWRTGTIYDFLIVNSRPGSGQFDFNENEANRLIDRLSKKYSVFVTNRCPINGIHCAEDMGMTITDIGNVSLWSNALIMGATGPCWTTFNIWNTDVYRLIILKDIKINFGTSYPHFESFLHVERFLEMENIL